MTFTPATTESLIAFLAIVACLCVFFVGAHFLAARRLRRPALAPVTFSTIGLLILLCASTSVVGSGWLERNPMPGVPLFMGGVILIALIYSFSRAGKFLWAGVPIWVLVAFQGFRLPLELVLHDWVAQGTIPETMTWTGRNFDVASGIVALLIAPLAAVRPRFAWIANAVGALLLLNVMRVAVLSSPLPFAWGAQPPLQLIFQIPYFLIVPVCVAGALIGHVLLTRALISRCR